MENKTMRVCVLSSGSEGNVTYVETPQHHVLIDAGLSGVKINRLLHQIGRDLNQIDMLFVTHEHSDHSKSVGVLARRCPQLLVYANEGTWDGMLATIGKIPRYQKRLFPTGTIQNFDDLTVMSFGVSHDANEAQCYLLKYQDKKFVIITDTGYVSSAIQHLIKNANAYVLECNYDVEMLWNGSYSWALKQRIISDSGHMGTEDEAEVMSNVIGDQTEAIFIAHRSHENNTRVLARQTVARILKQHHLVVGHDFNLYDTDIEEPTKLISL